MSDGNDNIEERPLGGVETPLEETEPRSRGLCCPACGRTRIRSRNRPLFVSLALSLLSGPLLAVCFVSESCLFGIIWLGVQTLVFFVLPTAVCIALFGRHRCRDCGHRFQSSARAPDEKVVRRFPWLAHGLNVVLVLALCFIGPIVLRNWNCGRISDVMADANNVFMTGFMLCVSMTYQIVVYGLLGRRIRRPIIWIVLFVWPGIAFGGASLYWATPVVRARAILSRADLAALPESATELRVYEWSSPFSGEEYLRFTAEPNDIRQFEDESPALEGKRSRRYKVELELRAVHEEMETEEQQTEASREVFPPHPNGPPWYRPGIDHPARSYEIQPEGYHYPGEVIVDDEQHAVYVYLCFS